MFSITNKINYGKTRLTRNLELSGFFCKTIIHVSSYKTFLTISTDSTHPCVRYKAVAD